jgi:hypothetical protein
MSQGSLTHKSKFYSSVGYNQIYTLSYIFIYNIFLDSYVLYKTLFYDTKYHYHNINFGQIQDQ